MNTTINEEKQERAKEVLEAYCQSYKIFIDTCSLLHDSSDDFWMNVIPMLHKYNNKIIIPLRCAEEVKKHSGNITDIALANKAKSCLKIINQLVAANHVEIRGEETDTFADNVFYYVFAKFRLSHRLLLITQDNKLARDILSLNNTESVRNFSPVNVRRINKYGFLSEFFWNDNQEADVDPRRTQRNDDEEINAEEIFDLYTTVTRNPDIQINVSEIPVEGGSVFASNGGEIRLTKELGSGGEAIVYLTNTPYVAKVYRKENITSRKYQKIQRMLSKKIECNGICYPIETLYNANREFVGYLMPQAKGVELQRSVFGPKPLFQKKFPNWKKRDTVELSITILEKIKYLHDRNIIMGDINPLNILVVSPSEVYFVDTDSYQIEDYPCPVGTYNFTAPEIQGKHFQDFLRTKGNEYFAVATLLFMIMLPGKSPYAQQGGEDPVSNILKMDFSYPLGVSSNKKTPDGPWRYIWSHLTYDIKKAFYNTFRKDGDFSTEQKRLSVDDWLPKFRAYLSLLDSGKYESQDELSVELFPNRYKKNSNSSYTRCILCGQEAEESRCQNGICPVCLEKGEVCVCKKCGKEFIFSNYNKYIKGLPKYDICKECYDNGKRVRIRQSCIECGKPFELTNNQYDYYISKGLELPKRCEDCRGNRASRANSYDSKSHSGKRKGSFCFITTAVCEGLGKPDDCYELTTLRNYRDTWLSKIEGGMALIEEYYKIAPLIVSQIQKSDRYEEYCDKLLHEYINPCLEMIERQEFEECKEKYKDMVMAAKTMV